VPIPEPPAEDRRSATLRSRRSASLAGARQSGLDGSFILGVTTGGELTIAGAAALSRNRAETAVRRSSPRPRCHRHEGGRMVVQVSCGQESESRRSGCSERNSDVRPSTDRSSARGGSALRALAGFARARPARSLLAGTGSGRRSMERHRLRDIAHQWRAGSGSLSTLEFGPDPMTASLRLAASVVADRA
jgi:hypothetical protein